MNKSLLVEILAYAPTAFYHCMHCEVAFREMGKSNRVQQEQMESSLPVELAQEYQAISDWVREIFSVYGDGLNVKVIDAASIEGVMKSLRYKTRRFPAVIVDHNARFVGIGSLQSAANEIDRLLKEQGVLAGPGQAERR
jgi:hypothetical protein